MLLRGPPRKAVMCVTIDKSLLRRIDELRGREKRSTFVEYLIQIGLKTHEWAQRQGVIPPQ